MQIYAHVNGIPFARVSNPQQATAVGAALMGGVGVGIWDSYEEAAELLDISKRFTPNEETTAIDDQLHPIYKQADPTLKETFDKVAAYQVAYMREEGA